MGEERAKPISLQDLGAEVVDVTVTTTYGRTITLPLRLLTWIEWNGVAADVRDPAVKNTRRGANGEMQPNFYDMQYQAELAAANEERAYRRLAFALREGGNDIPGKTLEEAGDAIRQVIDYGIATALINLLGKMATDGKARILDRAESFQDGRMGAADAGGAGAVAGQS